MRLSQHHLVSIGSRSGTHKSSRSRVPCCALCTWLMSCVHGWRRWAVGAIGAATQAQPSVELVSFAFEDAGPLGLVLGECFEEHDQAARARDDAPHSQHAVVVSQSVRPGSAADLLGIVPGLLLHSVGAQPVTPV